MHILPQGGLKICSKAESLKNDIVGSFPCAIKKRNGPVWARFLFTCVHVATVLQRQILVSHHVYI